MKILHSFGGFSPFVDWFEAGLLTFPPLFTLFPLLVPSPGGGSAGGGGGNGGGTTGLSGNYKFILF